MESSESTSRTIRAQVLALIETKERLEQEIHELQSILDKNGVGMDDSLVDSDGFPLANVDIYQVRHARHLLIHKQNDHKKLMSEIEEGLAAYYGDPEIKHKSANLSVPEFQQNGAGQHAKEEEELLPFAIVTVVHAGSPADTAGIVNHDLILEFGSLNCRNFRRIEDIGSVVSHSRGQPINVRIKRGERILRINLVPREWNGRGLLGCNVNPIPK